MSTATPQMLKTTGRLCQIYGLLLKNASALPRLYDTVISCMANCNLSAHLIHISCWKTFVCPIYFAALTLAFGQDHYIGYKCKYKLFSWKKAFYSNFEDFLTATRKMLSLKTNLLHVLVPWRSKKRVFDCRFAFFSH